jgi:hypothetical protein
MSDAPWGTVRIRQNLKGEPKGGCTVYADGKPVAELPVVKIAWLWDGGKDRANIAHVELTLLAERTGLDTHEVTPSPSEGGVGPR